MDYIYVVLIPSGSEPLPTGSQPTGSEPVCSVVLVPEPISRPQVTELSADNTRERRAD